MKKPTSPLSSASKLASLIIAAFPILPAAVQAVDWSGSSSNVWTAGGNWVGGTMPVQSGTARFADGGNGNTVVDLTAAQQSIYHLLFDTENAAAYTIGAGGVGAQQLRLVDGGMITVNSNVTTSQTINANLVLGSTSADRWYLISNHSTTPGQLLTLAGNISGGVGNGWPKTAFFTGAGNIAVSGVISDANGSAMNLAKAGPGLLTLTGANKYTGTTQVGMTVSAVGQTPVNALGGGTLRLDFSQAASPTNDILYNGVAKGGVILGAGNLEIIGKAGTNNSQTVASLTLGAGLSNISIKAGAGGKAVLNLGAILGGPNLSLNQLNFDIGAGVQDATNGITTTTKNSNGVIAVGATIATVNRTDWATNATNTDGGNIVAYTGYVASTGMPTGNNRNDNIDYVTDTTVASGFKEINSLRFNKANESGLSNTLTIGNGATLAVRSGAMMVTANVGANDVVINGGTLVGGPSRGLSIYQYNTENTLRINSVIADNSSGTHTGLIAIGGGGKVQFNGANTFSQGVLVNEDSTLIVGSESNLGGNTGTIKVLSVNATNKKVITVESLPPGFGIGSSIFGSEVANISGTTITLKSDVTVDFSSPVIVSWATAGAMVLNGGTLAVTDSFVMEQSRSAEAVGGPATVKRNIGLGASGGTIDVAVGKNLTVTGIISSWTTEGVGGLVKAGDGTLTLSGNNTYLGGTNLKAGVVALNSAGALGTKGQIEFTGGTMQYGANNATDYSDRFSAKDGQAFKVDTNGQNVSFGTALKSTGGSLTVSDSSGTGSLTLTKANTYTGETTVAGGTLKANLAGAISNSSAINVNAGATLDLSAISNYSTGTAQRFGGGGTVVAQSLTIQGNFQTHDTANGIGTLNVTNSGAMTFANGAHYSLTIGETGSDALVATGVVKLGVTSSDRITMSLNLTSQVLEGTIYTFMSAGSGLLENNGLFIYNGVALADNSVFEVAGNGFAQSFRINYGTTGNTLTALDAIPEPGTWVMLVAGAGALALGQRLRRRP